jgi:FlaA1/EpsC-like NDP-sugar epimerase
MVMVTGAGGSIGSELCRQVARFGPAQLVLFELSEFALYQVEQEFRSDYPALSIVCAVGDTRNGLRVEQVLREYRPRVVFHAAAYKHVPLMEEVNAWDAVQNNVLGTYTLAEAARQHGVEEFVLISTDKAVNPVNVMGASKRLAEIVCQALGASPTCFIMVPWQCAGSAGSVIPSSVSRLPGRTSHRDAS